MTDALPPPPPPVIPPLPPKEYMLNQRWNDELFVLQRDIESFELETTTTIRQQ